MQLAAYCVCMCKHIKTPEFVFDFQIVMETSVTTRAFESIPSMKSMLLVSIQNCNNGDVLKSVYQNKYGKLMKFTNFSLF